jgi:hypothetical protein
MTQNPPPPPLSAFQRFRRLLGRLAMDISVKAGWAGIPRALMIEASKMLLDRKRTIDRLVEKILAGTYKPREPSELPRATRTATPRPERPPDAVEKKFGWLKPYVPAELRPFGGNITALVQDPEMAALITVAPEAFGRPLRSLCWALGWKPPALIAPPKRPRKPRPEAPKPEPEPPLEWDWNGRLSPEARANVPHADPLIYRMGIPGVRRPKGTRRGPPKMA